MSRPGAAQRRTQTRARAQARSHDRQILRLAVPAFFALVAEPMFLLADAAIVGHLGTPELAAVGIVSAVMGTLASLCVFLAYGTTASVARQLGAGRTRQALRQGIDGLWLAVALGIVLTVVTVPLARPLVRVFAPGPAVEDLATTYLRIALLGVVPLLLMLAATGVLRGLQDTRTPLVVAVGANLANIGLNLVLVYGALGWAGLGLPGSALGTLVAQVGAATVLVAVVVRGARRERAAMRPEAAGVLRAGRAGVPLVVRTLLLRASLLVMTYAAARQGESQLATMQLALTLWTFLSFVLDAVAIAAQALTGRHLGAGDAALTREVTARMSRWGWASGIATGLLLAAASPWIGRAFTSDQAVLSLLLPVLLVAAAAQPLAGIVFLLDGVLIGAGDAVFLAWAQAASILFFAPVAWWLATLELGDDALAWLWVAFGVCFMGTRAATLLLRARGEAWMRLGA